MPLTNKQLRFAAEYPIDCNGTQAAIRAGYSERSAASIASDLLKKPEIQAEISRLTAAALERAGITLDKVVTELGRIGFSDIRKVVHWRSNVLMETEDPDDEDAFPHLVHVGDVELVNWLDIDDATASAIAEISLSSTRALKVKMHPKRPALADLMRYLQLAGKAPKKPQAEVGDPKPGAEEQHEAPNAGDDWADIDSATIQ